MSPQQMATLSNRITAALAGNPPTAAEQYSIECEYERQLAAELGTQPVYGPAPVAPTRNLAQAMAEYLSTPVTPARASGTYSNRYAIFGLSVTALIRWFGANGYKPAHVRKVLAAEGITGVSESTINCQLVGGRHGTRGAIPELTDAQINVIRSILA